MGGLRKKMEKENDSRSSKIEINENYKVPEKNKEER